jgi:pyruvate formate lyase activating enzyme
MLDYLDLVYMDIKHMDDAVHKEITGVSNRRILENVRNVAKVRPLIIRVPVIPGLNDTEDNMLDTRTFAAKLGSNLQRVELLPYHKLGTATYQRIGMEYKLEHVEAPSDDHMQKLKEIVESEGVKVQIGG